MMKIETMACIDVNPLLPYFGADSIEANTGKLIKKETAQSQQVRGPVFEFSGQRLLYSKIRPYLNKLTVVDLNGYCSLATQQAIVAEIEAEQALVNATRELIDRFEKKIKATIDRVWGEE